MLTVGVTDSYRENDDVLCNTVTAWPVMYSSQLESLSKRIKIHCHGRDRGVTVMCFITNNDGHPSLTHAHSG